MKLSIRDLQGNASGELEVSFEVISNGRGSQAVHDTVVAFMAGRRSGTASAKTMGEVAGTGKKPWRQKGTGRARAGSFQSPLWRGGGVVHGPKPRDFSKKVNKKVARLALRKAMSERLAAGDVQVVSDLKLAQAKTKEFVSIQGKLGLAGHTVLFVMDAVDDLFERAARNVVGVGLAQAGTVNTYEILRYDKLVFTRDAFARLSERLAEKL
ncbi:MAG: 50S ribosomal protein L4 [Verrucomicrobiota bacterium]